MGSPPEQRPERSMAPAEREAADSLLLIDQFLPRYDLAVVHARVFRAPRHVCYQTVLELDLFRTPLIRSLLTLRGLPQRLASTLTSRGKATTAEASRGTFRLKDMVGLGWILLDETPGVEMVLGDVSRPWKAVAASTGPPLTPEQFSSFDRPGFARIATGRRVDPYGSGSSILTMETRVAIADDQSCRRFNRYWLLVGPFSSLTRRMTLRQLAAELRRSAPNGPSHAGLGS